MYLYALVAVALFTICKSTPLTKSEKDSQTTSKDIDPDPNIPKKGNRRKRSVTPDTRLWWPDRKIRYEISSTDDYSTHTRATIAAAFKHIEDRTCLRFEPRDGQDGPYMYLGRDKDNPSKCSSQVGYYFVYKKQPIKIGNNCFNRGTVVHEILHRLGFFHEHSRNDRDRYVTIKEENIKSGEEPQFALHRFDSFGQPYDYNSVMHYDSRARSKNGRDTIVPNDKNAMIGQWMGLSDIDAYKVNRMFKCNPRNTRYQRGLKKALGMLSTKRLPDLTRKSACPNNLVSETLCKEWMSQGYCGETHIARACPKVCSYSRTCVTWARNGYCRDEHTKKFMLTLCHCRC